ncbi:hypothetical protein N656DRAFT_777946 [Canariomyces notabilis]|uniref:Uncharacterized protein n=1 Tax=Canariomyces notabilis TaxID=2074819 RepID=A0AAN6TGA8_9PEZI|nr:hypothetical protein N656DRAFT_777946 [Canariomyces arenarius]
MALQRIAILPAVPEAHSGFVPLIGVCVIWGLEAFEIVAPLAPNDGHENGNFHDCRAYATLRPRARSGPTTSHLANSFPELFLAITRLRVSNRLSSAGVFPLVASP